MKVPAPPPAFEELMEKLRTAPERITAVMEQALPAGALTTEEYLPWDKLRYKTPPGDLSLEEWWFAVKFGRRSAQRMIPALRDNHDRPFTYALPDQVLASVDEINRAASGNIAISEQVTNPDTRDRYLVSSLIEEAITSSQLEGAATTREVAKEMIRSGRPPKDRSERMIINNYFAMQRVVELREKDLTPEIICELQRIVTDGTLDNPENAGKIQSDDAQRVAVYADDGSLLFRPPPAAQLLERMDRLCDFANGGGSEGYMHAVLRAIAIHFMMGYDHYFEDGNGRTARILFYWAMLRQGYWLTEFLTISRILKKAPAQYARSFLLTEQDEGDLTHFFIYQLGVVLRAIRELHEYLAAKAEELRQLQLAIKAMPGDYNYRQLALLENAAKNPGASYTAQSHALSHRTSQETARQDLIGLEKRGLLMRSKRGRKYVWGPVNDLAERLGG
jgi:Fic family protein